MNTGGHEESHTVSLLQEMYGSHTVRIPKHAGENAELPESLRMAASLRTCGDPCCFYPQHLTPQAREMLALMYASFADWLRDGCPDIDG